MKALATLGNGRYTVTISEAGGGCSQVGTMQLTRWRNDPTRDADGWFLYLRDEDSGACWSAAHQPMRRTADRYEVLAGAGVATIIREDGGLRVTTEITVSPARDVECRRYTITNLGTAPRHLSATTYAEVALATADADAGHPAFSKLFIQTAYSGPTDALLASRRPRGADERPVHLLHALHASDDDRSMPAEFETDRAAFLGRGRSTANPVALDPGQRLHRSVGDVLDPIVAMRRPVTVAPGATVRLHAILASDFDADVLHAIAADFRAAPERFFAGDDAASAGVAIALPTPGSFRPAAPAVAPAPANEPLQYFNGHGGFSADGREYVVRLDQGPRGLRWPPMPWANVVANEEAGFVATEAGPGFTWCGNSRLNRLTPWSNDPVTDPAGEALYIRDDALGCFWSPTPGPVSGSGAYEVRHQFGSTSWRHASAGLIHETTSFVPRAGRIKLTRLRITNTGRDTRRLTLFAYAEWVLGGDRRDIGGAVTTAWDPDLRALLATRQGTGASAGHTAFCRITGAGADDARHTADRTEFLGTEGDVGAPAALVNALSLSGATGQDHDPCAAFQLDVVIPAGATGEWTVMLGQDADHESIASLLSRYDEAGSVAAALDDVRSYWRDLVTMVTVETPSAPMNLMLNGWLTYQNLSCRMWARSAFYQSGGAYGYRDQLQDSSALVTLAPSMMRSQLLRHAAHQFVEGDVLHWWHPPESAGIRTRFADDLVWLPYLTAHYLDTTGDYPLLDEWVSFVDGPVVPEGEDEIFFQPSRTTTGATFHEHCCRALDRSLTSGAHGLPLMGSGDWNDGMNRVGRLGRGESVWMAFFLYATLERFATICEQRGESGRAARYRAYRAGLDGAANAAGWDGGWYRRAYYDNGTPLGTASGDECRIDLIAQAWAVMSGAAPPERATMALDAMEQYLVDVPAGLIRLLTPPFDRTPNDPGYIKGYLPGVRENGGQYTHAALWAIRALAEAGRTDRAFDLFDMITPVERGATDSRVATYLVEPYVVAADVYGMPPHVGRGGWTWYTGSAGWMFRVGLESLLGITLRNMDTIRLAPAFPSDWPGFAVTLRHPIGGATCRLDVTRGPGSTLASSGDDEWLPTDGVLHLPFSGDRDVHYAVIVGDDLSIAYRPRPAGA